MLRSPTCRRKRGLEELVAHLAALGAHLELVAVFDDDRRIVIELGHDNTA